ncbi:ATP-grasp domain-containing protein [Streptomyces sp. NBC_00876]|uniref:ATP-grasp domain-containing protein n=1 Tax=Streptomyces sp. NBC_00876 TaxID=2975853 RepID=UPI003863C6F2|nr:ATP-grasp domain-containing protein [Streptomyces sp. NBC_00876]
MSGTGPDGAAHITHVMAGFGAALMPDLDRLLPPRSLLVVEEPDVVAARSIAARAADHRCFAGLVTAPIHDEDDPAAVLAAVDRPDAVRAVLPGVEYGVTAAAALAEAWGLAGAGVPAARILRDKALLREAADRAGLPQPRWRRVASADEAERFRAESGGRCVLKPANRQGSLGVQLLDAGDDIGAAWAHTTGADEPRLRARRPLPTAFLAEQRLDGPEVSAEAVVFKGQVLFRNVTGKVVTPGRYPVEAGHRVPARLPDGVDGRIAEVMDALVAATGFRTGVLHAEWILADGEHPCLVECAGRVPGDGIHELIDLAHGGSFVADFLTVLGGSGEVTPRTPRLHAGVRFLDCPPGTVDSVTGADTARGLPGVVRVHVAEVTGRRADVVASSQERAGFVMATGATAHLAERRLAEAAAAVRFSVRPRPGSGERA